MHTWYKKTILLDEGHLDKEDNQGLSGQWTPQTRDSQTRGPPGVILQKEVRGLSPDVRAPGNIEISRCKDHRVHIWVEMK
jgi:hypothetical protein